MHQEKITILFVISANKTNQKGLCPLNCRITLNKQRKQFTTGVFVNSLKLHETKIKDVKKLKKNPTDFRSLFTELNQKLETLETMQRNDTFELFNQDAAVTYYYIPKHLLL